MKILDKPGSRISGEAVLLFVEAIVALFIATQTDSAFFRVLLGILGILGFVVAFLCGESK